MFECIAALRVYTSDLPRWTRHSAFLGRAGTIVLIDCPTTEFGIFGRRVSCADVRLRGLIRP